METTQVACMKEMYHINQYYVNYKIGCPIDLQESFTAWTLFPERYCVWPHLLFLWKVNGIGIGLKQ